MKGPGRLRASSWAGGVLDVPVDVIVLRFPTGSQDRSCRDDRLVAVHQPFFLCSQFFTPVPPALDMTAWYEEPLDPSAPIPVRNLCWRWSGRLNDALVPIFEPIGFC